MSENRRIIVMTEELQGEKQQQLVDWFRAMGAGWAHWFQSGFLVSAGRYSPGPSVHDIVAKIQELQPGHPCLVFELRGSPMAWQGFLPQAVLEGAKKWFREEWSEIVY